MLEMYHVRINHAGHGGRDENSASPQLGAFGVREEQRRTGGMIRRPVENVRVVRYAIARRELAARFERLDELGFFDRLVFVRACNFAGRGKALGEELCILGIEIE